MAPARSFPDRPVRLGSLTLRLFALAFAWALTLVAPNPAQAQTRAQVAPSGWSICNQSSYIVEVAHGRPSGKTVLVRGWIKMRPGECWTAAAAPLTRGKHYLYARTSTSHRGGRLFWGGPAPLCVDTANAFSIENPGSCEAMGLEARQFREVLITKRDGWRTNLREAEEYDLASAKTAGLQRLLIDAGVQSQGRIGAMDARRVSAAIARFRQEAKLPANSSYEQLIDALEQAARRHAAKVGLTLCNRTTGKIWAAIARRRGEGWESRGWWGIGPNGCARTLDEPLQQNVYFVHAALVTPQGDRFLAAGGESFCTSPAKFAVIGREECDARHYDDTLFTAIAPQNRQGMVVEFFDRDFLPVGEIAKPVNNPALDEVVAKSGPAAPERDSGRVGRTPPASAAGRAAVRPDS